MTGSSTKDIERDATVMYDRLRNGRDDMQLYVACRCKVIKAALGCGWTPEMEARIKALDRSVLDHNISKDMANASFFQAALDKA